MRCTDKRSGAFLVLWTTVSCWSLSIFRVLEKMGECVCVGFAFLPGMPFLQSCMYMYVYCIGFEMRSTSNFPVDSACDIIFPARKLGRVYESLCICTCCHFYNDLKLLSWGKSSSWVTVVGEGHASPPAAALLARHDELASRKRWLKDVSACYAPPLKKKEKTEKKLKPGWNWSFFVVFCFSFEIFFFHFTVGRQVDAFSFKVVLLISVFRYFMCIIAFVTAMQEQHNFRKTKANKQTDNKRQSRRQGRIPQKKENRILPESSFVCVFRFRKIDRKPENDRRKMSFLCVCVLFTERKRMKEIQVLEEERHCLGFFFSFPTSGPGPKVPQKTPCPDAPPVSFGPPHTVHSHLQNNKSQPTDLQNNKSQAGWSPCTINHASDNACMPPAFATMAPRRSGVHDVILDVETKIEREVQDRGLSKTSSLLAVWVLLDHSLAPFDSQPCLCSSDWLLLSFHHLKIPNFEASRSNLIVKQVLGISANTCDNGLERAERYWIDHTGREEGEVSIRVSWKLIRVSLCVFWATTRKKNVV